MIDRIFFRVLLPVLFLGVTAGAAALNLWHAHDAMEQSFFGKGHAARSLKGDMEVISRIAGTHVLYRTRLSDGFFLLQRLMHKQEFKNFKVVRAYDGELNYGAFDIPDDITGLQDVAVYIAEMKTAAERRGGKLLFYLPPTRPVLGSKAYRAGMPWLNLGPKADSFLNMLREWGVDFVDGRYRLADKDIFPETVMYRTEDALLTTEASFALFRDVVGEFEDRFGISFDPKGYYRDTKNYDIQTFENFFLGKLGTATAKTVSGIDDFTVIRPKFDNDYSVSIIDATTGLVKREGPADKTLFHDEMLVPPDTEPFKPSTKWYRPYDFYLMGLHAVVTVKNRTAPGNPRILLVHDSVGIPVGCFLAPLAGELVMINPTAGAYAPDVLRYLETEPFDAAVVMLSAATVWNLGRLQP